MSEKPPYRFSFENEVKPYRVQPPKSPKDIFLRMVEGTDISIMLASRDAGYHTAPHVHDAEQFNYIIEGELWIFVEEHGYRCVKGDIMRVPRNKIHWAWNRGTGPCVMLEAHTPPLTGDAKLKVGAVAMMTQEEESEALDGVVNLQADYPKLAEVEERAICEAEEANRKPVKNLAPADG